MKGLSLALLMGIVIVFSSCERVVGDGPVRTETRSTDNFSGIDIRIPGTVHYTQSNTTKLEISAQQNILNVIETYVSNNILVIKYKQGVTVRRHDEIVVHVNSPQANTLSLSGSANIYAENNFNADNLLLEISGSGNISLKDVIARNIEARISGSGNISAGNGTATSETLKISGSGNIDLANIVAHTATTSTSGSGHTKVHAVERLNVTISGSGSVYYKGNPIISSTVSGSGKLKPM